MLTRRFFLIGLLFTVQLAAASAANARTLHESSRIALYSAAAEPGSHNSHPAKLDPDRLSDALSRVRARSGESGEVIDLFPVKNREEAAKRLAMELRKLEPDEELHLVSFRRIGHLISSQRNATGARVFVEDGRLNFIFGQIDRFYSEFRDPDRPIPPMGSRKQAAKLKGKILPADGLTFVNGRNDWVALDLVPVTPPQPVAAPPAYGTSQQAPMATSPNPAIAPREKTIEEKLQILKNLREKDLITEEEYTTKKKQILDAF